MKKLIISFVTTALLAGSLSAMAANRWAGHGAPGYRSGGHAAGTWHRGGGGYYHGGGGYHRGGGGYRHDGGWDNSGAILGLAAGAILGGALANSYSYGQPYGYGYPYQYPQQCYYYPGTTQIYCPQPGYTPYPGYDGYPY